MALQWFKSYLINRSFAVLYGECLLTLAPLNCGVPQGSIFLLFCFVVYTAFRIYFHFYADDTQTNKYVLTFVASGLNINGCVLSYF